MANRGRTEELSRLRRLISEHGLAALFVDELGNLAARKTAQYEAGLLVGVYSHYDEQRLEADIGSARVELKRDRRYVKK